MDIEKWDLLDHFVDVIRDVGGIEFFHSRLYAGSHNVFKNLEKEIF